MQTKGKGAECGEPSDCDAGLNPVQDRRQEGPSRRIWIAVQLQEFVTLIESP